ncbi:PREDICTED: ORM1-like protein 1 [Amphimedon queenslandica]|uniref:ORM1-like protein 3 n=1 Tax=Amphimedon queenslandica TaxID=400682 RepID=A0A1X7V0P5_AMPQE|nr:PREDICTED: ORM1-like protein 1 [Amphimedon queenslandica]|eukprot:XP_003386110.1 PREDICTED: ORM1-like protein 1 [Amphimedon queenslandica]
MLASSETNPNAYWLNSRGMWAGYTASVIFLFILVNCIPVISIPVVWTLTHGIHNIGNYIMFHYLKGTPYATMDQGETSWMTNWEQIDNGEQFTPTRNFLTAFSILLFILAGFFTIQDTTLTAINIAIMLVGVVPKLPLFHGFRLSQLLSQSSDKEQ